MLERGELVGLELAEFLQERGRDVTVIGEAVHPADRVARESELRAEALSALRGASLR